MKKILSLIFCFICLTQICSAQDISGSFDEIMLSKLCPRPKFAEFKPEYFILQKGGVIKIATSKLKEEQIDFFESLPKQYWRFDCKLVFTELADAQKLGNEGYSIDIDNNGIVIEANGFSAVHHAFKTLRQMSEKQRDGEGEVFAFCKIKDAPTIAFRAIHLCALPETSLNDLEKYVRLASFYKFNYVIIQPIGVFPFKSHPEFCFNDKKLNRKKLKKLIKLCKQLGLTPFPEFSILGHASQARLFTGKHAVLNSNPEYADIFEPNGWSYCMSSARCEKILKDLISELYEFYENPPFFHFGCDEAFDKATCYKCRHQNAGELFAKHIKKFTDYLLEKHNARPIIWHDMLLDKTDSRWKNQVATGSPDFAKVIEVLDRRVVIADWQYSYQIKNQEDFPTSTYFKSKGFDVVVSPWHNKIGAYALAKNANKNKLWGYLGTTWHYTYRNHCFDNMFLHGANAAWNGGENKINQSLTIVKNYHVRLIENDANIEDYKSLGTAREQIQVNSIE